MFKALALGASGVFVSESGIVWPKAPHAIRIVLLIFFPVLLFLVASS